VASGSYQHEQYEKRRAAYLNLIVNGRTHRAARKEMGVSAGVYANWRLRDPEWKAAIDAARQTGMEGRGPWHGDMVAARQQFFGYQSYYHHIRILQAINETPPMGITLVLLPPEHGKSTVIADWISVELGKNKNLRVAYVSEGLGLARKVAKRLKNRMTQVRDFPVYIAKFGPFHEEGSEKPWAADFFTIDASDHDEQDFSFEARGWKSAIAGSRVDVMIVDDIQSRKSLGQTEDMIDTFRQDFVSRVGKVGRIIIIGTRVGDGDVYEKLIDEGIVNKLVELPATTVGEQVECPEGAKCNVPEIAHEKPLCPEMWNSHQLAVKRKQVGEVAWWRNFQQQPRKAGDLTFTEEAIDGCKDTFRVIGVPERLHHMLLCGLDPALGGGNALVVATGSLQTLELVDCQIDFGLARTEDIISKCDQFWARYRFRELIIEVNAFQRGLARDDRLANLSRLRGFQVRSHTTGLNKLDENLGVASMATSFHLGEITIPWGDGFAQDRMTPLINQLLAWRPAVPTRRIRQDLVMALWFVWLHWMRRRTDALGAHEVAKMGRQGLPWKPQGIAQVRAIGAQR
jgi:hypothetical protein